ncbi:carbohydrate kinase [Arthrobacter sp. efr-133-TYG-118]|uniref:carbohydrate kinase family protein n=1 Tax=Arthrobacter sp. efr-133-TYG-118 TaxID=3040279 RepID=UPI00254F1E4B|nr:carbohydrate kinase [Arthrobacter sp. efr-133-TYG-118]
MADETTVTVIGESLVDVISDPRGRGDSRAHAGGSPLNVAVGAARLDLRTNLVTHYSDDHYGLMIDEHLQSNGVRVINGGATPTSTALATLGPDGGAEYIFSITWDINGAFLAALATVEGSTHVHTGSIATVLPPGDLATLALVESARDHATISFDPNCRPGIGFDAAVARQQSEVFVAASDIVKASDEDLRWLYPDRTPDETLESWLALGPAVVALTRGPSGPVVLSGNARVEMAAEAIVVADTVGAGDSFMAGLISGLAQLQALGAEGRERLQNLSQDQLHSLAAYANRAAAITCSRQGANPPRTDELGPLFRT